jgi:hypothetical protein
MKRRNNTKTKSRNKTKKQSRKINKKNSRNSKNKNSRNSNRKGGGSKCLMQASNTLTETEMKEKFGPYYFEEKSRGALLKLKFKDPSSQELDKFSFNKICNWNIKSPYDEDTSEMIQHDCERHMLVELYHKHYQEIVSNFGSNLGGKFKINENKLEELVQSISELQEVKEKSKDFFKSKLFKHHISVSLGQSGGGRTFRYVKNKAIDLWDWTKDAAVILARMILVPLLWVIQKIIYLYCSWLAPFLAHFTSGLLNGVTFGVIGYYNIVPFVYAFFSSWMIPLDIATAELLKVVIVHDPFDGPIWDTGYEDIGDYSITRYSCTHLYSKDSGSRLFRGGGKNKEPKQEPMDPKLLDAIKKMGHIKRDMNKLQQSCNEIIVILRQMVKSDGKTFTITFNYDGDFKQYKKAVTKLKSIIVMMSITIPKINKAKNNNNSTNNNNKTANNKTANNNNTPKTTTLSVSQKCMLQIIEQLIADEPQSIELDINDAFINDESLSIDTKELNGFNKLDEILTNKN